MASAQAGTTMAAATTATATASATTAGLGNMIATAALTSMASTAAVSAINNKGNLGAVVGDVTSSSAIKGYLTSAATAGIASQLGYDPTKLNFDLASAQKVAMNVVAQSFVKSVINGGSFTDSLGDGALGALIDIAGAVSAQRLGNTTLADGSPTKIAAHALLGGLKSMAMGGDFKTGAIAGGANEGLVQYLAKLVLPEGYDPANPSPGQAQANLVAMSQLVAVLTTVVTGGDSEIAANIAANATQYNYLTHSDLERAANSLNVCAEGDAGCVQNAQKTFMDLSREREIAAINACAGDITACKTSSSLAAQAQADQEHLKDLVGGASQQAQVAYGHLVAENFEFQNMLAGVTTGQSADAIAQTLQDKWGMSDAQMVGIRESLRMIATMGMAGKGRPAAVAKTNVPSKTPVQELDVDSYKNLKAGEVVGDGLEHDHIPSFAALRTAKEVELGRPLTEQETKALYQNSTAVEVPRDVHIAGPTYGCSDQLAAQRWHAVICQAHSAIF